MSVFFFFWVLVVGAYFAIFKGVCFSASSSFIWTCANTCMVSMGYCWILTILCWQLMILPNKNSSFCETSWLCEILMATLLALLLCYGPILLYLASCLQIVYHWHLSESVSLQVLFCEIGDLKRYSIHYDRSGRSKVSLWHLLSSSVDLIWIFFVVFQWLNKIVFV